MYNLSSIMYKYSNNIIAILKGLVPSSHYWDKCQNSNSKYVNEDTNEMGCQPPMWSYVDLFLFMSSLKETRKSTLKFTLNLVTFIQLLYYFSIKNISLYSILLSNVQLTLACLKHKALFSASNHTSFFDPFGSFNKSKHALLHICITLVLKKVTQCLLYVQTNTKVYLKTEPLVFQL